MSRHYRIAGRPPRGHGTALLVRAVPLAIASVAAIAVPRWGVVVAAALLAAGAAVLLAWHRARHTAFALTPTAVAVGRWRLPWPAVTRIAIYDLADSALLGVRLRSPADLPANVPAGQLDQTDPAHPVILVASAVHPSDVTALVPVFRRIAPTADLVHHTGTTETTLVPAS
jgi:hypothetical protein